MTDELGFLNSYDTWHGEYNNTCIIIDIKMHNYCAFWYAEGTKNVANKIKTIAHGAKKLEGLSWWHELSDKRKVYVIFIIRLNTCIFMARVLKSICTGP